MKTSIPWARAFGFRRAGRGPAPIGAGSPHGARVPIVGPTRAKWSGMESNHPQTCLIADAITIASSADNCPPMARRPLTRRYSTDLGHYLPFMGNVMLPTRHPE
ncbi:hypothetical protein GCM10010299_55240 [Streptomyces tanashiensis]|nr:hypothetical protein GCM10010299_55240 [Streptomyces tanashiensis]